MTASFRTIKGALNRGYAVSAILEAVISVTPERKKKMVKRYTEEGVTLVPLAQ